MTLSLLRIARIAYIIGFAVITWDRFLVLDVSGFHIKLAYFFLIAATALDWADRWRAPREGLPRWRSVAEFFGPIVRPPWVFWLAFAALCFVLTGASDVPKKSAGYSMWAAFDLIAFAATGISLFARGRADELRWRARLLDGWIGGVALVSAIAIIDFIAFFFGAREGWIGFYQTRVFEWTQGVLPRPQAFSYEPSYLALAIAFVQPTLMMRLLLGGASAAGSPARDRWKRDLAQFVIVTGALAAIFSRTGFLLLAIEAALVAAFLFTRVSHGRKAALGGGLAAILVVAFLLMPAAQRRAIRETFLLPLFHRTDVSMNGRLYVFAEGFRFAKARPWGSGPGTAMKRWLEAHEPGNRLENFPQNATSMMSVWPEVAAEEGWLGLALAALFFVWLGVHLARNSSIEARGVFIAYLAVAGVGLLLMPTITRADLWSLLALAGIFAADRPERQMA